MHTQTDQAAETEILKMLERTPQKGMEALLERYTGLLWSVAAQHLHNPEDIKECVNDTFMEFYRRQEQFDPQKGSLKTYLAAIARNLAVSRYRNSESRTVSMVLPSQEDPVSAAENRLDLERAIASLEPTDAEMIRMKYYGGMSLKEIAASLNLPYETVKKRHQRSLGRMRKFLLAGLVLLLAGVLAACAYIALQHFGIIPGYRMVKEPGMEVWVLTEPVTDENDMGIWTVSEAILIDGQFSASVKFSIPDEDAVARFTERADRIDSVDPATYPYVSTNGTAYLCSQYSTGQVLDPETGEMIYKIDAWTQPKTENGNESDGIEVQPPEDGLVYLQWETMGLDITFSMERVTASNTEDYSCVWHELAGLVAIPRRVGERLHVELYALPTGEGYTVESKLIWGHFMEGHIGDITLTGADGQTYMGEIIPTAHSANAPRAGMSLWDFGEVEPGEYTLNVPYLFLTTGTDTVDNGEKLPVDLMTGVWEDSPVELPFGTLRVTGLEALEPDAAITTHTNPDPCLQCWQLTMEWEPPTGLDMTKGFTFVSFHSTGYLGLGVSITPSQDSESLPDNCFLQYISIPEDMAEQLHTVYLTVSDIQSYRWNQSFDLAITAE